MTRKKYFSILILFVFIMSSIPVYSLTNSHIINPLGDEIRSIIVQYNSNSSNLSKMAYELENGLIAKKNMSKKNLMVYQVKGNQDINKVLLKLNQKKDVEFAELDYKLYPTDLPNDYFDLLWGLNNANDIDIDGPEAWTLTEGSSQVVVAVIDTGVQINHLDLLGQFVTGYDFYNKDTSVYDGLDDDHGTHVSGTIAALKDNNGIVGVAPLIKIMPLKFLGPDGGSTSDAIEAIYYAKANGADIINASWGGGGYSTALKNAIEEFGGPFVAAAGNNHANTDRKPHYPSAYDSSNIVSVAAVTSTGGRASFSNYGAVTVDLGAPGVDIASTYPSIDLDGFAYMSGTSMAAPHVSGVLALMMSHQPGLSTDSYIQALFESVMPLDSLSGKTVTGGMVNAYQALLALEPPVADTTPPQVINATPLGNDIAVDASIEITFDEAIQSDINYNAIQLNKVSIEPNQPVTITLQISNDKLIILPDTPLDYESTYQVTIPENAIGDLSGNSFSSYTYTFTTQGLPDPTSDPVDVILSVDPENKSRNIPITTDIQINFNQIVTINDISKVSILDKSLNTVTYTFTFTDNALTIHPDALDLNIRYQVIVDQGAFTSSSGNPSASYTWVFTTVRK